MSFSSFIAKRYYQSKSKWNIVNIISRSASFVLAIAVCSFFVVLSVFSGLKNFGDSYSRAFDPEIKISPKNSKHFKTAELNFKKIEKVECVAFLSKQIEEKVLVQNEENNSFAYLIGVDEKYSSVVEIDSVISLGKWIDPSSSNLEALVSYDLADELNLGLFNYGGGMSISVPSKNKTNSFFKKNFSSSFYMIAGIFNSSDPVDQKTIFTSVSSAQKLLGLNKESVSSVIVKTTSNSNLSYVSSKIKDLVGNDVSVKTRKELNETYYKMLNSEELILNFVLGLILIVAMFNTVGAIIILVIEKKKNIKTLHKLGASPADIRQVFFMHGLLLSYSGGGIGLLIGCLIIFLQEKLSLIYLSGTSIPYHVIFDYKNFLIVSFWVLVVGYFGSLISSKSVNKIKL